MDEEIKDAVLNAAMDLRNEIIKKINSNIPPPNAPSTIARKSKSDNGMGEPKTLQDTGNMWTSINDDGVRELDNDEGKFSVGVGIFDEGVAQYAIANEYGSVRTVTTKNKDNIDEMHQGYSVIVIPERSFMRSAYDENIDEIMKDLEAEIGDIFSRKFMEK